LIWEISNAILSELASSGDTGKRSLLSQPSAEILIVIKPDKVYLPVKFR
jgi:hypothetical protein